MKTFKVILLVSLAAALLIAGCSGSAEPNKSAEQGNNVSNRAPDFTLTNLEGKSVSLSDFRGKPLLLNFWATSCPPCRYEMPFLQEIYEKWSDKGVTIVTIDIGEEQSQVSEFMKTSKLTLPVLLDVKGSIAAKYSIQYIPTTYFIDKDGIIKEKVIGAFTGKEAIETKLQDVFKRELQ